MYKTILEDIQTQIWEHSNNYEKTIFIDDKVLITAKFQWDNSVVHLVDNITFKLRNLKPLEAKFEICDVTRCHGTCAAEGFGDYVLLHLTKKTEETESEYIVPRNKLKNNNGEDINLFPIKLLAILFKVHDKSCHEIISENERLINEGKKTEVCDLVNAEPESKDGTIIISI